MGAPSTNLLANFLEIFKRNFLSITKAKTQILQAFRADTEIAIVAIEVEM